MLPGHKFGFVQRKPVLSSSAVKKSHPNKIDKDSAPTLINDGKQNAEEDQNKKRKANNELYSELYSSPKKTLLSKRTCDENNNNSNSFVTVDSKSCVVFRNWYLLLTDDGEILIEGNVKCDIVSRGFPIAKRLANNKLQSVYKRIYILDGTIKKERRRPEYIEKRFHNGFPEDWEVLAHFWLLYRNTSEKKLPSFKWPEPMTSSITSDEKNIDYNKSLSVNTESCQGFPGWRTFSLSINTKSYQVFSCWRVLINNKGQLIIEGTSQCGNIKRSKPIVKRFSNKKVLCSCHEVYVLDGTLINERNDLPDYVRWKFYNGFPVDWENVYQHWKNYLSKRVTDKTLF